MKKRFNLFALIMATLILFSACGTNSGTSETSAPAQSSGAATAQSSEAASAENTEAPTELTMAYFIYVTVPTDQALVEAEINKIAQEKINATMKFVPIPMGNYQQQLNLMLSSGEKIDLVSIQAAHILSPRFRGSVHRIGTAKRAPLSAA